MTSWIKPRPDKCLVCQRKGKTNNKGLCSWCALWQMTINNHKGRYGNGR